MKTRFLLTSALIEDFSVEREAEYKRCVETLRNYGVPRENITIVECVAMGNQKTYLEDLDVGNVFYSRTHNSRIRNKGVLEGTAMKSFFQLTEPSYGQDDLVVKLTGRYWFTDPAFVNQIEQFNLSSENIDIVAQFDESKQQFRTGCFAMRYKFLRHFMETLDYTRMESNHVNIELRLAQYASMNQLVIGSVPVLGISALVANEVLCHW